MANKPIVARYGNRCHAPEHSRAGLLSAHVLGADVLWIRVRMTSDGHAVLATDDDTASATGEPGRVSATALHDLRQLDYSRTFTPRGSPGFRYRPEGRAPLRVEVFSDFLDWVPESATVLVEVDRHSAKPVVSLLFERGVDSPVMFAAPDRRVAALLRKLVSSTHIIMVAEIAEVMVVADSMFDIAGTARPVVAWIRNDFQESTLDTRHFAFGYAKANPFARVYLESGVRLSIAPFQGPLEGDNVTEQLWFAQRNWPFYSGGGFGLLPGVRGDFTAEIDVAAAVASQATMCEMAAVNVDPAAHRAEVPTSARHQAGFYDPHGAPPFVGVEHDEDDGYRINWNLGTTYDANQYGPPVGDGSVLAARLRLDRRGPYFAAHYRNGADATDWVCLGAVRNDSMNPMVYLRVAGKRWRQERDDGPGYFPVVANDFAFTNFAVDRVR